MTMSELKDFSPAQLEEVRLWVKDNIPEFYAYICTNSIYGKGHPLELYLANMYFQLKMISIELRPNQFVIGVDYKGVDREGYIKNKNEVDLSKAEFNLSFWNPHPKGVADELSKDFLIAQLSKL